jgi:hypothetical protein
MAAPLPTSSTSCDDRLTPVCSSKVLSRGPNRRRLQGSRGRVAPPATTPAREPGRARLQKNVLDRRRWRTRDELHEAIVFWPEHTYNRPHASALGKLTPGSSSSRSSPRPGPSPHDHHSPGVNPPGSSPPRRSEAAACRPGRAPAGGATCCAADRSPMASAFCKSLPAPQLRPLPPTPRCQPPLDTEGVFRAAQLVRAVVGSRRSLGCEVPAVRLIA